MLGAVTPPSLRAPPTPAALCAANPNSLPCQPSGALFCQIFPNDTSCYAPAAANYSVTHWGILAAALVSAFIVYKFATR